MDKYRRIKSTKGTKSTKGIKSTNSIKHSFPTLIVYTMFLIIILSACKNTDEYEDMDGQESIESSNSLREEGLVPTVDKPTSPVINKAMNFNEKIVQLTNEHIVDCDSFISYEVFTDDITNKRIENQSSKDIIGGIIPHHNVAHSMMNTFYQNASGGDYDLIVLISPNHYRLGPKYQIYTGAFKTYAGMVYSHENIANYMISYDLMNEASHEMIDLEHGQNVHMPYISYYFPDTKVISLSVIEERKYNDLDTAKEIIRKATQGLKVLYVASIDFSHFLNHEEASINDQLSKDLIMDHDFISLLNLDDAYIDSPTSYTLFIEQILFSSDLGLDIIDHNNSAVYLNIPSLRETTSYLHVEYYNTNK